MNRLISTIIFLSLSLFLVQDLSGQAKYSNEFLSIGVGARAQGMSNAQVANVNDVTAGYWNPAGLTGIEAPFQIGVMHSEWFAGIAKYDYIALAKPLNKEKKSAIALSIIRLGIDNIPNTLNLVGLDGSINYDNITEFSAADYAVMGSYARELKPNLTIGGNVKIVRRVIGEFGGAWGFGIDLGAQYKLKNWRFGLMARDVTSTFNAWTFNATEDQKQIFAITGNDILESSVEITRPRFILGVAHDFQFGTKVGLLVEANFDFTTDGQRNVLVSSKTLNIDPHLGLEVNYNKFIFLRGGVINFQKVKDEDNANEEKWTFQPNFGVGIVLGGLTIDYAYTNIGNVSDVNFSNVFSLKLNLKKRKSHKKKQLEGLKLLQNKYKKNNYVLLVS